MEQSSPSAILRLYPSFKLQASTRARRHFRLPQVWIATYLRLTIHIHENPRRSGVQTVSVLESSATEVD